MNAVNSTSWNRRHLLKTGLAVGAGGLAAGLAGGCSPDAGGGTTGTSSGGSTGGAKVTQGPERTGIKYPSPYKGPKARDLKPFSDGKTTIRVVVPVDSVYVGDWATNKFMVWLEQRTGLKIQFDAMPIKGATGAADMTKVNAMIASGDLPDAFFAIPFSDAQVSLYGAQGLFKPLDALVTQYAPNLQSAWQDYPTLRASTLSADGKLYQIKAMSDCMHCRISPARMWVNKKMLDKVGATIPKTTEEYRQLLKTFKEKDPVGGGQTIPFMSYKDDALDGYFLNSFLYNPGPAFNYLSVNNGKMDFAADKPEWREGVKYVKSLFDDGTVPKSVFTATVEEQLKLGNAGRIATARTYYQGTIASVENKPDAIFRDYVAIPALKGPGGVQYSQWDYRLLQGNPLVITKNCKNPELLVQWADYQLELEAQLRAAFGPENDYWTWGKDGETGLDGRQATYRVDTYPAKTGDGTLSANMLYYFSLDYRNAAYSDPKAPDFEKLLYDASLPYKDQAPKPEMQLPKLIFSDDVAAQHADLSKTIGDHVKQSFAKFCTGELNPADDAAWKTYTDAFSKMGLQTLKDITQKTYDSRPK